MRCGGRNGRSTAVAATASGGATMAPSAIAGAHGIVGMSVRATTATAAVVNPTANTTRPVTGAQLSLRSLSEASYAASSRTGATKSASASSGGSVNDGAPGTNASSAPPSARNTGYGAPTRRAARRQDHGRDEQTKKLFEFPHRAGTSLSVAACSPIFPIRPPRPPVQFPA